MGKTRPRWYSLSTWLALGVIALYFLIGWPSSHDLFHSGCSYLAPLFLNIILPISILLAAGALTIRVCRARLTRTMVLWTALRYGIVSLGAVGYGITAVSVIHFLHTQSGPAITKRFHDRMEEEADIPAIRAWMDEYVASLHETVEGRFFPDESSWPPCIAKLQPRLAILDPSEMTLDLHFGEGRPRSFMVLTVAPRGESTSLARAIHLDDGAWVWLGGS